MRFSNIIAKYTLILAAALPVQLSAAPAVTARLDSTVVTMGDLNRLVVSLSIPAAEESTTQLVDFPMLAPGTEYIEYNGVDIVASDSSSVISDGVRHIVFNYTLQAFDPGTVTLPPFALAYGTGADTAYSNVLTMKVLPVDVDSLETIHPMASVVAPQTRWYDYLPAWLLWTLLGIAAVAAAVWCYLALRKHKEILEIRKTPVVPPYDLAVSRLNTLRARKLPDSGQDKEYYTELVDILRQYLQGRFGINAMEMTSTQIVKALRSNAETRMTADMMRAVLSIADFVKFAKVRPLPDDNNKAFARAMDFVEQTKPAPEPEAESDSPDQSNTIKEA